MTRARRWWAPEVVQTSSMDCGPAALKCLLEGHHVPVGYGRLREACQTDVDGTSIDTLEVVAQQLGLAAQQQMLPVDHVLPAHGEGLPLPALLVVRHADVATHFVVAWRRVGAWVQVMDPALGRRWVPVQRLRADLFRHETEVPAADWRLWAGEAEARAPWRAALCAMGAGPQAAEAIVAQALQDAGWRGIATLDAALRLVQAIVAAGGIARGDAALRLVGALCGRCAERPVEQITEVIPENQWSVLPVAHDEGAGADDLGPQLRLRGAVLLRVSGLRAAPAAGDAATAAPAADPTLPPLSPDLAAALNEPPVRVLAKVWHSLRKDGLLAPLALAAAIAVASGAVLVETLLLRGLFELPALLHGPGQTLTALVSLLVFMLLLAAIDLPVLREIQRHGRHLDARLRMALLRKLPRLADRYFQSRPVSDMADRSHALHLTRQVPALGFQGVQTLFELACTLAVVLWLAPHSAAWALALTAAAVTLPWLVQPMLRERDLRARNHHAALNGYTLDALLGLVPVRAHRAEANVAAQHESLLVAWTEAVGSGERIALLSRGLQGFVGTGLAIGLVASHVLHAGAFAGTDLLLAYFALKLPALGARLSGVAQAYPAQRNVLMRLLEPLTAPEDAATPVAATEGAARVPHPLPAAVARQRGVALEIRGGDVVAAGHPVLHDVTLALRPGEHVAVVGTSGAGKSSLLGVLLGWHRLAAGELMLDGRPAGAAEVEALRAMTAWVDPAVQLWNRSLLDNLTEAARPEDRTRLADVIETARLRGVLARLPQGLQTLLGEGGGRLSGGEGQRVRLARALLATDTRLVLLDEPFRGLDRAQRHALLTDARRWWRAHTLLCVTHDVGETLAFDRVIVVHDGRIVEDGAPRTLALQPSRYRALLAAERALRKEVWSGPQWRRLAVQDGRVVDAAPAADVAAAPAQAVGGSR